MPPRRLTSSKTEVISPPSTRVRDELIALCKRSEPQRSMDLQDWFLKNFRISATLTRDTQHRWVLRLHPAGLETLEWLWGEDLMVTILERSALRRIIWMGGLPLGVDNLIAALRLLVPVYRHGE